MQRLKPDFFLLIFFCVVLQFALSGVTDGFNGCYSGAYQVAIPPFNDCAGFRDCEPGYYCINGKKTICPSGYYGDRPRLNSTTCSDRCPAGFFCPPGTTNAFSFPCGNSTVYCPIGSSLPTIAPNGFYTVDSDGREIPDTVKTRSGIIQCPIGYYCVDGIKTICPAGRFGNSLGLSNENCTGICPEGFYCPAGSANPFELSCGDTPNYYCPEGSGRPNKTSLGYYAIQSNTSKLYGNSYVAQVPCPLGSYCIEGVRYLCPAGRYGLKVREYNSSCTGPCRGGYYCPEGSIISTQIQCDGTNIYCPESSALPINVTLGYYTAAFDRQSSEPAPFQDFYAKLIFPSGGNEFQGYAYTSQNLCEPGFYCLSDGVRRLCPRGRYGATYGLNSSFCSGYCEEGYYCPQGSTSAREHPCGGANVFCPRGSYLPQHVHIGYYTIGGNDNQTRTSERLCEPGFYCRDGVKDLCQGGYYGSTFGLIHANCTGPCEPGYYCPTGSISATEIMCGDPSRFCPENSTIPSFVALGYYSIGGNESTRNRQTIAPPGYFALEGLLYPCPAGYYGAISGLSSPTCSGICNIPGYYCPTASISPFMRHCGGDDVFCPAGTVAPIRVHSGFYTVDYQFEVCPPGRWRNLTEIPPVVFSNLLFTTVETFNQLPFCQLCPDGTYKSEPGDSITKCLPCNKRNSRSSPDRKICDCTRVYPDGFVAYFNVSAGVCEELPVDIIPSINSKVWAQNMSLTRFHQYPCEPGYYCRDGLRYLCPSGYYGALNEEIRPLCTGLCAEGYYCPVGSTSPYMIPCGQANFICPTGSPIPVIVPAGYYTNEDVREDLRFKQFICPTGYYCPGDGRRYKCPHGTFTNQEGTISDQCMGPCDKGYYCLEGSSDPRQFKCGNATVYCPTGSYEPQPVHEGFYCSHTGNSAGADRFWDSDNSTCSVEIPCEPGYYCTKGIKHPCPPGTFGWRYGLHDSKCDGLCAAGYYCPSYLLPQPDAPSYTIWPGKPHIRAAELECGDVNYYCPRGSYYPLPVRGGYYSIGGNADNKTRRGEVICPPGSYCVNSIPILCPRGRFGQTAGLTTSDCTDGCPAAFYCPGGTVNPIPCPDQTYSTGLTSVCSPCPAARDTQLKCQTSNDCCNRY